MESKKSVNRTEKIGIIGLGIMGGRIAGKFIKKGYKVFIYDINDDVIKKFTEKGAIVCKTPKEVAQKSDIIFEVTVSDLTSKSVWDGEKGILAGATAEKTLITCSTLSAEWVDTLAEKCNKSGFIFFDMPMTADIYNINLHCGGDKARLKLIKPVLRAFARKIIYFGPPGQGIRYKLILNFLQALQAVGFGQAMKIAKAEKMDLQIVIETLTDKVGELAYNLCLEDFQKEPDWSYFPVEKITKDLRYAKKLSKQLDVSLLDATLVRYDAAMKKGYAKKDWFSVNFVDKK